MAAKRTPGSRPGLVHCDHCGEDYSESYRRCPFCDDYDYDDDYSEPEASASSGSTRRSGGKRLAQSTRQGGGYVKVHPLRILSIVVSLVVILFAIWIVVTKLVPLIRTGDVGTIDPNTSQGTSDDPNTTPSKDVPSDPVVSDPLTSDPGTTTTPEVSPSNDPNTANGFSLSSTDFSFTAKYPDPIVLKVTFSPAGTTSTVTWSSSNPDIASVDQNGKVSHGTKKGTATITATIANGVSRTCTVYNQISGGSSSTTDPTPSTSQSGTTTYQVNNPDFTFYSRGETYRLKVKNYTGGVTWSSSNTAAVTVGADGTCTAVGNGKATITGTLDDGSTVKATVYVRIS